MIRHCLWMAFLAGCVAWGSMFSWAESKTTESEVASPVADATLEPSRWPKPMPDTFIKLYFDRVALFEKENASLDPAKKYAVFVGDSLTQGFPLEESFPGMPVLNRGIISDGIGFDERGILNRMDSSVFDCQPGVVFLLIGVNDLPHEWVTLEQCSDGYRQIVKKIEQRLPDVKLVLCTCLPTGEKYRRHAELNPRIVALNQTIKALAKEKSLPMIDLYQLYRGNDGLLPAELTRDGLHLKKDAYGVWARAAKRYMGSLKAQ